jgi:hypothetical protein
MSSAPDAARDQAFVTTSKTVQRICVWCGPAMAVIFAIGFLLAGVIPPPSPNNSAQQIALWYRDNAINIRWGLVFTIIASALLGPYFSIITVQMRRMEGVRPTLAYTQLALGALAIIEFIIPVMIMQGAAFRTDRDPLLVQALNDVGWIMFLGVVTTFMIQLICFGVAILLDRRSEPIFPRWVGYFNIWISMLFMPGTFLVFFHTGPLAWNGLFIWWIPFAAFLAWFPVNTVYLLRAVNRDDYQPFLGAKGSELRQQLEALRAEVKALRSERVGAKSSVV